MKTRSRSPRAGFTLVEATLCACLTVSLLFTAGLLARTAMAMFRLRASEEGLAADAHRVVRTIARELASARRDSLQPDPLRPLGSNGLDFRCVEGYAAGAALLGPPLRIAFEYETGELDDGKDDNGNGLVDEGVVVLVRDLAGAGEQRTILCHGVREFAAGEVPDGDDDDGNGVRDDAGLSFWIQGDFLSLQLTLEERGPNHVLLTKSSRSAVRIRN